MDKQISAEDTLIAFNCCVSLPRNCVVCPLSDKESLPMELDEMEACIENVKDNIRYWLSRSTMIDVNKEGR